MTIPRLSCMAIAFLCLAAGAPPQSERKAAEKEDAFLNGPPFSLQDLFERVGVIADKRLGMAIERRGISFTPTAADYERLHRAGASIEILDIIRAKAPAPPPPPPPPPKPQPKPPPPPQRAGPLTINCLPVDCEISINGRPRGRTIGGRHELHDLMAGEVVVDLRREGFESQQFTVTLPPGVPTTRGVVLKPTRTTQLWTGKLLFSKMVDRLGGAAALEQSGLIVASGRAVTRQDGGEPGEWQVTARLKLPALAMIELVGTKDKWWTSLNGSELKTGGSRKITSGPLGAAMETWLRLYRDYQPSKLVAQLQQMSVVAPDVVAAADGSWRLVATGPGGPLQITIDKETTPLRVVMRIAPGQLAEVDYADYGVVEKAWYPKTITLKFDQKAPNGLELRFAEVGFMPRLADKEFHF